MDALSRIERMYGCVSEYNRSREEDSARNYKNHMETQRAYERNRQKISEYRDNGFLGIAEAFCGDECIFCNKKTDTFYQDEDDDIGIFFCLNENCEKRKT